MKLSKICALLLALCMLLGLVACGDPQTETPKQDSTPATTEDHAPTEQQPDTPAQPDTPSVEDSAFYGPIYDDWSKMSDEELYAQALEEVKDGSAINIYATSSKMLKVKDTFEEAFPGLTVDIMDLDNDEVLQKCRLEANANNVQGDVLQVKDVNGDVFFGDYEDGIISAFYPEDICAHIDEDLLRYWVYNAKQVEDNRCDCKEND